ncbi:MAG: RDD family protein [Bryobacteraceae bacterium]|nr:RDD family protein [Bryobacteraceae bacterium]
MISCRFCGTSNAREDDRCFRCGRRLHLANARSAPDSYRATTVHEVDRPPVSVEAAPLPPPTIALSSGAAARMAPIVDLAPTRPATGLPGEGDWGSLSFQQARDRERAPESDIYTDHAVAPLAARMMAGFFDTLVMLGAFGLMAIAYALMTRDLGADPVPGTLLGWTIYGVLALAVIVFYRSLFILAGTDSPGMRWAGLRLVTFDGDQPATQDRFMRVAWGAFSALPLGLGLFWAWFDQERLTWHDLLSKTFPSPDTGSDLPRWSK